MAMLTALAVASVGAAEPSYTLFESGQVRPLALDENGRYLFAVNTPDNRLEILARHGDQLRPLSSVSVGLEPVAVNIAPNGDVWVVNHLSDSISIVDVSHPRRPFVRQTLQVGDEPSDIVFAGRGGTRAFITTAHRGQNSPVDPALTTPGVGRADVWVFDLAEVDRKVDRPHTVITLFTDKPRALAVSPDGNYVYAAGFHTGNRTTTIFEELIPDGGEDMGGVPSPRVDAAGQPQPETGLIVQHDGSHWVDELGRVWDDQVRFRLPDKDVFLIDAAATPPAPVRGSRGEFRSVGTILYNMAVNPVSGHVYVSNTEALNLNRFEGHGEQLGSDRTVRGHFVENRISVIDRRGRVLSRHLNKHIDYSQCCDPVPNRESETSLALPTGMVVSPDGRRLYVAAFGSAKVGVFDTRALENDSFFPDRRHQVDLTAGGPSGLVLDARRDRLYVMTRFDNGISVVDTRTLREVNHLTLHNPEPTHIVEGRRFLYDARYTSSRGDSSCASCHVFGDVDSLAWDLGNPDEIAITNPGPFVFGPEIPMPDGSTVYFDPSFQALKGPMTTQSLRGLANHGAMHWRGDRTGGNLEPSVQPDGGSFDEREAFRQFNAAFEGLVGRDHPLPENEMEQFIDFALEIVYPPNPIRNLDNSLTPEQEAGREIFFGDVSDGAFNCNGCHALDPAANAQLGVSRPGFFGTDGRYAFVPEPQFMKVPHLRNMYQKVGMFGMAEIPSAIPGDNGFMGDQIRGFGFFHDGSVDTIFRFHAATIFVQRPAGELGPFDPGNPGGFPFLPDTHPDAASVNPIGERMRREVESFMFVFDSNLAPIVGQQVTLRPGSSMAELQRAALLRDRADVGECDLVAKWWNGLREVGFLYRNGQFKPDRAAWLPVSERWLYELAQASNGWFARSSVTLTCAPPGSGRQMALDRDGNGVLDGDEFFRFAADRSPADAVARD